MTLGLAHEPWGWPMSPEVGPWALPCHMRRTNHLARNVGSTTICGSLCTWIGFYQGKTGEKNPWFTLPHPLLQSSQFFWENKGPIYNENSSAKSNGSFSISVIIGYYRLSLSLLPSFHCQTNGKNQSSLFVFLSCILRLPLGHAKILEPSAFL